MAQSALDSELVYPVRRNLETADIGSDAWEYTTPIRGVDTNIAIGQPRDTFMTDYGIIVYPVYEVAGDRIEGQIGVYEVREDQVPNVLADDGALRPELLPPPVLYPVEKGVSSDAGAALDAGDDDGASETKGADPPLPDTMETAAESKAAMKAYRTRRGAQWIQNFMKNAKYRIVPSTDDGDCLFTAIKQGLESRGKVVTIAELRGMLASEATEELFEGYSLQYAMAKAEYEEVSGITKKLTLESRTLRRRMKGVDRASQMRIAKQAHRVTKELKHQNKVRIAAEELLGELDFMDGISNLQAMKSVIQSQTYWADTWAVSTLERLLNVKFIIFSKRAFDEDDMNNVLLCGQHNDDVLERRGRFVPDLYLLLSLSGTDSGNTHYELISYDGARAFDFAQLPYRVRHLVLTRCLEKVAGPYSLIPDFIAALATVQPVQDERESSSPSSARASPRGKAVFQMYGKSAGGARPGEGTGETLNQQDPHDFSDLAAIPNWRRLIADDGPSAKDIKSSDCGDCIELDGKKWATVRHYALAARYAVANPEFSARFAYHSGDKLGHDIDTAVRVSRGTRLKKGDPEPPEEDPDADTQEDEAAARARAVKFAPGTHAREALLATKDAVLRVYTRGAPAHDATEIMDLRSEIAGKKAT